MNNAKRLADQLTSETVLGEWFHPMDRALDKVRFSEKLFTSLPMREFILFGCLRQVQSVSTLREMIQQLFHADEHAVKATVARSTWSDALSSQHRRDILNKTLNPLIESAQRQLPDRLAHVEGIGNRAVIATDATYQKESCHFYPISPSQGGTDNKKGHQHLTHFDLRTGIPLMSRVDTQSIAEIKLLKEALCDTELDCMAIKSAIHVVDRAFIDALYWDKLKVKRESTMITRMKSNLKFEAAEQKDVTENEVNQGVTADQIITLASSTRPWRLIDFTAPDGERYQYLTNDFDLEPGVIAFLYHRRWDIEKYFDNIKNDMTHAKAWGKSHECIEQQGLLAMASYILMRLFMDKKSSDLGMANGDTTQKMKHQAKQSSYIHDHMGIAYRAFHTELSKVTRQMWRFLKNCFAKKSSPALYKNQFKPLWERYL